MMSSDMQVIRFEPHARGSMLAFVDLALASGLIIRRCRLHCNNGEHWIGLPARSHRNADGAVAWTPVITFIDQSTRDRFQKLALAAVLAAQHDLEWLGVI